jgi:hypothetical protein
MGIAHMKFRFQPAAETLALPTSALDELYDNNDQSDDQHDVN